MGESPSNIIQVYRDLADGGDILNVPLIGSLRGPGVSTGPLTGNEEPLDEYGMRIWVDWIRNAVLLTRAQMRKSAYDQLDEVRPLLSEWMQGITRDEIILLEFDQSESLAWVLSQNEDRTYALEMRKRHTF